jgi:hypothetical protein
MSKLTVVLAAGVGYVLGAKAGQGRYEEIKAQANRLWRDPRVQDQATRAQELVKENAPKVQGKVSEAALTATSKARTAVRGKDDDSSTASPPFVAGASVADPVLADPTVADPSVADPTGTGRTGTGQTGTGTHG